jgi:hypothetical protein
MSHISTRYSNYFVYYPPNFKSMMPSTSIGCGEMTRSCASIDKELHMHCISKIDELRDDCEGGSSSREMNMASNQ